MGFISTMISSFRSYNKVEIEDHHNRLPNFRYTRYNNNNNNNNQLKPLLILIFTSAIILTVLIISSVSIGTLIINNTNKKNPPLLTLNESIIMIKSICNFTHYPNSCFSSLQHQIYDDPLTEARHNIEGIFRLSLSIAIKEFLNISSLIPEVVVNLNIVDKKVNQLRVEAALRDCKGLIEDAIDKIETSISSMEEGEDQGDEQKKKKKMFLLIKSSSSSSKQIINNIKTWISAALTDQDTCLDGLEEIIENDDNSVILTEDMKNLMQNSKEFISNSLAIITNFPKILRDLHYQK